MALPITPALVVAAGAVRPARCPDLWTGPAHGRASAPLHGIPRQPVLDRLHRSDANSSCPSVDCVTRFGKRDDPPGRQPRSAGGQHHEADGERRVGGAYGNPPCTPRAPQPFAGKHHVGALRLGGHGTSRKSAHEKAWLSALVGVAAAWPILVGVVWPRIATFTLVFIPLPH